MHRNKIYFRADADAKIGFGHFIRTLALADMLKDDFECVFFTAAPTDYQKEEVNKVCKLVELQPDNRKFNEFLTYLTGNEIVFLDNYFFDSDYEKRIKDMGARLFVLAPSTTHHYADVVFNYLEKNLSKYSVESYTQICAGQEWTILRKPFLLSIDNSKRRKNTVVISFGGTDQYCLTEKVLEVLSDRDISVICTSRIDKQRIEKFKEKGVNVFVDVSAEVVANVFEAAEFAILSSSTICIEALSRGCKVMAGYYIDNQINYYKSILKDKLVYPLGDLLIEDAFKDLNFKIDNCLQSKLLNIDFTRQKENYLKIFKKYVYR